MKVEYGEITLGDDVAGDLIEDGGGTHERAVQVTPLDVDMAPFVAGRALQPETRTFTVTKIHEDAATAVGWWNRHPGELAAEGELRITEDDDVTTADAALRSVERGTLSGRTTILRYTFVCPTLTAAV